MDASPRSPLASILGLDLEPAALRWCVRLPEGLPRAARGLRFCAKVARAMRGESFYATEDEEACQGGARYCGLCTAKLSPSRRSGEFLVTLGLYRDVAAVQRAWSDYFGLFAVSCA